MPLLCRYVLVLWRILRLLGGGGLGSLWIMPLISNITSFRSRFILLGWICALRWWNSFVMDSFCRLLCALRNPKSCFNLLTLSSQNLGLALCCFDFCQHNCWFVVWWLYFSIKVSLVIFTFALIFIIHRKHNLP